MDRTPLDLMPVPDLRSKAHCSCGAAAAVEGKPHATGCPNSLEGQKLGMRKLVDRNSVPLSTGGRPKIEGCICGMDERDLKARHSEECWDQAKARIKEGLLDHAVQRGVEDASAENFRRATEAEYSPCPECGSGPGQYHKLKCGSFDENTVSGEIHGVTRTRAQREIGEILGQLQELTGRPQGFRDPLPNACPDCGAEWAGDEAQHKVGCERAQTLTISGRTCPCGQPSEGDTRTNVYRGDELVEVRYPHEDGECCWTRSKR